MNDNVKDIINEKTNIASKVWDITKKVGKVAIPLVVSGVANNASSTISKLFSTVNECTYSGAVDTVMNSNMWSSDKQDVIKAIGKDESPETYKAICSVAESMMWSADKRDTIIDMCKKEA